MNNKEDGGAGIVGVPTSNHWNQKAQEYLECVQSVNLTPSASILTQFTSMVANYAVVSKSFVDDGVGVDVFALSPQSNFFTINDYIGGMEVYFIAKSDSSTDPMINIDFLGDRGIVNEDGSQVTNEITAGDFLFLVYNSNTQLFTLSQNIGSTL